MKLFPRILSGMMLCVVAACGSSSSNNNTGTGVTGDANSNVTGNANSINSNTAQGGSLSVLTVSGTVSNFAFDANALVNNTNTLQVAILNPNALYPSGSLNLLSATPINPNDCTTTSGVQTCKFSIANVDTSAFVEGLMVATTDSRVSGATGDTTQWQTLTTFVTAQALSAAQTTGTLDNVVAYDLSEAGRAAFAALAGTGSAGLSTTGAVIGLVTGSDGKTPVSGATVTEKSGDANIFYANAAVTAGTATGGTSSNGLFLAAPAAKTTAVLTPASVSITAASGTTESWTVPTTPAVSPLWMVVELAASAN